MRERVDTEIGTIPDNWDILPLDSLVGKFIDNRGKTVPTIEEDQGYHLIATNCIKESDLFPTKEKIRFLNKETYDEFFRGHPIPGDIIIVNKGTPGLVCMVPDPIDFCIAQDMVAMRINKRIYNKFLFAYLRSRNFKYQVSAMNVGTTIPHLKKTNFQELFIPVPTNKNEQIVIGDIYYTISEKINLLCQQNQTLEQLAQTLFKRWFVEFEFPNQHGQPYKSSGGNMVDSELGEIPEGWRFNNMNTCLESLIDNRGKTPKYYEKGIPALSAKFVKGGKMINSDAHNYVSDELFNSSEKLKVGDIIMTSEAPLGELYYIAENTKYFPAQRVFALRADNNVCNSSYLYYWFNSFQGQYLIQRRATGTTVQGIKQSELLDVEILVPTSQLLNSSSKIFEDILLKQEKNNNQIQTLTQLRDTLLPKLMSGDVRVKI